MTAASSPLKIAIVYDRIYPYAIGGGEKRNWEIARRLAVLGHDVSLLGMQYWPGEPVRTEDKVRLIGVCKAVADFDEKGRRSFTQPLIFARGVFRAVSTEQFDVVECCNFPYLSCFAVTLAQWRRAALTICWFEARGLSGWTKYQGLAGFVAWLFELATARLSRLNTAISRLTRDRAIRLLGMSQESIAFVPCGVNFTSFNRSAEAPKREQLLYVGRLVRHKRVDVAIRTLASLAHNNPDLRLKIVGRGDEEARLRELSRNLGVTTKVVFVSELSVDELEREFAASKVFVFPSEQEGFGIVIVEAMAAGTPVVALDAPDSAAKTIIQHGVNGMLATDEIAVQRAVEVLLTEDTTYRNIRAAGITTAEQYDWDKAIVPQMLAHYRCVAGKRPSSATMPAARMTQT